MDKENARVMSVFNRQFSVPDTAFTREVQSFINVLVAPLRKQALLNNLGKTAQGRQLLATFKAAKGKIIFDYALRHSGAQGGVSGDGWVNDVMLSPLLAHSALAVMFHELTHLQQKRAATAAFEHSALWHPDYALGFTRLIEGHAYANMLRLADDYRHVTGDGYPLRQAWYLADTPMGKVPPLRDCFNAAVDAIVTGATYDSFTLSQAEQSYDAIEKGRVNVRQDMLPLMNTTTGMAQAKAWIAGQSRVYSREESRAAFLAAAGKIDPAGDFYDMNTIEKDVVMTPVRVSEQPQKDGILLRHAKLLDRQGKRL